MLNNKGFQKIAVVFNVVTLVICIGLAIIHLSMIRSQTPVEQVLSFMLCSIVVAFTLTCFALTKHHPVRSLRILTIFYYFAGSGAALFHPQALIVTIIAFSACIMAGSLSFGRRFSLIGSIACVITLAAIHVFVIDDSSTLQSYDMLLTQAALLALVAIACWHSMYVADLYYRRFGKKLEQLTARIQSYEERLIQENRQELLMLYKFADAGRKSVAVLHNLANHLTLLSLDDDGEYKKSYTELNTLMAEAYAALKPVDPTPFDVFSFLVEDTVPALRDIADIHTVTIECVEKQSSFKHPIVGDRFQLGLAVTILVHNAIEAYRTSKRRKRQVTITVSYSDAGCRIMVEDKGPGISLPDRRHLFSARSSSIDNKHGIGLLTAREIIAQHFQGTLSLDPRQTVTRFVMTLPTNTTQTAVATAPDLAATDELPL